MQWDLKPMSLVVGGVVQPENVVGRVREATEVMASLSASGAVRRGSQAR